MFGDVLGETGGAVAQFVLALIFVVLLIILVAWVIKRFGGGRFGVAAGGKADLEIVDTLAVDPKRRLVLVRHGKLEHLLLIGGGSDEIVERSMIGGLPIAARLEAQKVAHSRAAVASEASVPEQTTAAPASQHDVSSRPEAELPRQEFGVGAAAAAAVTGLAAAAATSELAVAASRSVSPPPPPLAPQLERDLPSSTGSDTSQPQVQEPSIAEELQSSLEKALQQEARPASVEPTPIPPVEPAAYEPEFDLAAELEAALTEERGQATAPPADTVEDIPAAFTPREKAPPLDPPTEPVEEPDAAPPVSRSEIDFTARPEPVSVTIPTRGPGSGATTVNQVSDLSADKSILSSSVEAETSPAVTVTPADEAKPAEAEETAVQADQAAVATPQEPTEAGSQEPLIDLGELAAPAQTASAEQEDTSDDLDEEMRRLLGEIAGVPKRD
ncbi:MAG: flagellar biosynthetic protein FliO [Pseudomonadota bacterium]